MSSGKQPNINAKASNAEVPADETPAGEALKALIVTKQRFKSIGPVDKVLFELGRLAAVDRAVEKKQAYWSSLGWITGGLTAVFLVLAFLTFGLTLIVAIPALIAFIFVQIKYFGMAKANVENRRHQIPIKLLTDLRPDIPPTAKLELSLDLRAYTDDKFLEKKDSSFLSALSTYNYEVPWLVLKGVFMDGTKFRLRLTTTLKRKVKRKNKGTKVTETYREKYNLLAVVDPMRYGGVDRFVQSLDYDPRMTGSPKVSVSGERITIQTATTSLRHVGGINTAKYDPLRGATHPALLRLFMILYEGLPHCKGPAPTASEGGGDVQLG